MILQNRRQKIIGLLPICPHDHSQWHLALPFFNLELRAGGCKEIESCKTRDLCSLGRMRLPGDSGNTRGKFAK